MTEEELVLKQYMIYTPSSLASAVGGAMGMFLGWSVYQGFENMWQAGKALFAALQKLKKLKR